MEKKAVVIEDDCTVVYLLKQILKNNGIQSFQASSIEEGLKLIHKQQPDFLFLDNELPDGSGFDIISSVHKDCPEIHIIAMTAQYTFGKKDLRLNNGTSHFLGKPFSINQVSKALKKTSS